MSDTARSRDDAHAPSSDPPSDELHGAGTESRPTHALRSLLELGRDLRVSLDLFDTTDLLLFNLMGQVGAARGSLWLTSEQEGLLTIVRCHGFNRRLTDGAMHACQPLLLRRSETMPLFGSAWIHVENLKETDFELLHQAKIALLAPLRSHGELIGWIALGSRVDGCEYGGDDLEVLETALGMIVMTLENTRLFNRVREANRGLRTANDHLKELDRLKSEFLNNVNHELRTPIAVVLGSLECALEGPPMDASVRRLLETARECAHDLGAIIQNLLLWSECVGDRLTIAIEAGDARAVLEAVHRARLPGITEDLRELRFEVADELPATRFDPIRLAQILDELLDNAVKFTPRGTCLLLRGFVDRDGRGDWIRIEVEDNGPGIPADRLPSLFRDFEQVDGSMTRRTGGLGIGLAFARVLAQRMGGTLDVSSRVGIGTTFTLRLPVTQGVAAVAAAA